MVLRVTEAGTERRVEMGTTNTPFPLPDFEATAGPQYVNYQFMYEGIMPGSAGTLANPQWTGRITNGVSAAMKQFDVSLVAHSNTAKFNLARLDAIGVAGVANVAVEGDLLLAVTGTAYGFFPDDTIPGGIYLPNDDLSGVGIRDLIHNSSIRAKSIQAVAFGSHRTWYGKIESGSEASGNDAKSLLLPGTTIATGGDTYRVPFSSSPAQKVQLFVATDKKGGKFESKGVILSVQGITVPNSNLKANTVTPANAERGAVTAMIRYVSTFDSKGRVKEAVLQSIDLWGDGGSIQTKAKVSSTFSITSFGPLGDVILSKSQSLFNLTAPSIFGSIRIDGRITGLVQTTGIRIDPITMLASLVSADIGGLYVDTTGWNPVLTTTVIRAKGLSGKLVSRGNLISQVTLNGGSLSGAINVAGNLGTLRTQAGQLLPAPMGGLTLEGPLSGSVVVIGQILGAMQFRRGIQEGNVAAMEGILGSLLIQGGIDANSRVVSGDTIGSTTLGTRFIVNGENLGILAAVGAMNFLGGAPKDGVFSNLSAADVAALSAIFTVNGEPVTFDNAPFDLAGLASILADLKALRIDAGGHLAGPVK